MNRCWCCQKEVPSGGRYHLPCLEKLFGQNFEPKIPFGIKDISIQIIEQDTRMSISGVQSKASIRVDAQTQTLKIVSTQGTHILKPEPGTFPECVDYLKISFGLLFKNKIPFILFTGL